MTKVDAAHSLTETGHQGVTTAPPPVNNPAPGRRQRLAKGLTVGSGARRFGIFIVFLAVWEAAVTLGHVNPLLVPSPIQVGKALGTGLENGVILPAIANTLESLILGMLLGVAAGLILALLASVSKIGDDFVGMLVAVFNPLPSVAILPLALIWFGLSNTAIVFVTALAAMWPIVLNADMGFRTINLTHRRVSDNLGLSAVRRIFNVLLPASLPYLLSGLKLSWAFGWRTVVAAELVFGVSSGTGGGGLGFLINQSRMLLKTSNVFAGLVVISVLGLIVDFVFSWMQHISVDRWGMRAVAR